jgi:hypothetical protein
MPIMERTKRVRRRWEHVFVSDHLKPSEADFLAGFAQAEGHFAVREQNGGQSVGCTFSLRLRDDDTHLIAWLNEVTGLGSIRPIRAARTSAPQSEWRIERRSEVKSLAEILTRHTMYGRKAAEFAVWKSAVGAWNQDPPDRTVMRAASAELLTRRAYVPADPAIDITVPPRDALRDYLGGLLSGDGHFSLSGGRASMTLKQRQDELPLLLAIRRSVGLGSVHEGRTGPGNPRAMWVVSGRRACHLLAQLLDSTIRGRKAAEFTIWSRTLAAIALDRASASSVVAAADAELKDLRRYRSPVGRLRRPALPRVSEQYIVGALLEFAAERDAALDSTNYMAIRRERHPEWPSRDTVTRHFGSWYAALEAAGLAERAARTPDRYANRSRAVFDARRAQQRERVLASVRRFIAEVGHVPRAMEYFRWRLRHDPDTPTQATIYNLFPGGWDSVREAI